MIKKQKVIEEIAVALCREDGCNPDDICTTLEIAKYGNIKVLPNPRLCAPAWKFYLKKATIAYNIIKNAD